jgi:hypothetical protein
MVACLYATTWHPLALAGVLVAAWWPMMSCDPMRSRIAPLDVSRHVQCWRMAVDACGPGAVLAFEHDPYWTVGIHHQWLASYALARVDVSLVGGAGFDHAAPSLVERVSHLTPSATVLPLAVSLGATHIAVHSAEMVAALSAFVPEVSVTLPPLGSWPSRRIAIYRTGG